MQIETLAVNIAAVAIINIIGQRISRELNGSWRPVIAWLCGLAGGILAASGLIEAVLR